MLAPCRWPAPYAIGLVAPDHRKGEAPRDMPHSTQRSRQLQTLVQRGLRDPRNWETREVKLFNQGHTEWQNPDEKRGLVHSVDTSEWLARDEEGGSHHP